MKTILISGILAAAVLILPDNIIHTNKTIMNATMNETTVLELAMFKVKPNEDFRTLNKRTIEILSSLEGYLGSNTYQSISDSLVFLDIVEWSSLEDANKAAKIFETDPRFASYMGIIEEVKYFEHTSILPEESYGVLKYRDQEEGDILELASFYLKDQNLDEFTPSRIQLMDHMGSSYQGFKGVTTIQSMKDPTHLIDLGSWENASVCERAQKDLESDPLFLDFLSHMNLEKEAVMEFFVKIR